MYIIQELDNGIWVDRYKSGDLEFISNLLDGYRTKYQESDFRLIEVLLYV